MLFGDFTDPRSAIKATALKTALDRWPDDVRIVFVQLPNPQRKVARTAAETSIFAGGTAAFWKMHDRLFANPPRDQSDLQRAVVELGLDASAWQAAIDGKIHRGWVESDAKAARELGAVVAGTLYINGRLADAGTEVLQLIADERELMAKLVADGMPRDEVYAEILAIARPPTAAPTGNDPSRPDPNVNYAVSAAGRPVRGPVDARVTIIAFLDFQCPFCARVQTTLAAILLKHPKDVRIVFRNLPLAFHKNARELAKIALAAERKGKFWKMHDALFARKEISEAGWKPIARRLGLRAEQLESIAARPEIEEQIRTDEAIAAAFGVQGTPTFFVNGRLLGGAQPLEAFESLIEQELEKANEFAAQDPGGGGIFYDRLIEGFAPPIKGDPAEVFFD